MRRDVPQGSVLGHVLFSLFINDLLASLPSCDSCSLYADDLAIWSSYPSVPTAMEATQGALIQLERWSEYWCLPLNPSNVRPLSSQWIPTKSTCSPTSSYLTPAFVSIPFQLFLGSPSTAQFSFSKHISSLKTKYFPVLRPYAVSLLPQRPSKKSLSVLYKDLL